MDQGQALHPELECFNKGTRKQNTLIQYLSSHMYILTEEVCGGLAKFYK